MIFSGNQLVWIPVAILSCVLAVTFLFVRIHSQEFEVSNQLLDCVSNVPTLVVGAGSATSGRRFTGEKLVTFPNEQRIFSRPNYSMDLLNKINWFPGERQCAKWIVLTTIFEPSQAIKDFGQLRDWCTVVIADKKGIPAEAFVPQITDRVKYLTVNEQLALSFKSLKHIPWNHFARKNVGYLYAIAHGATVIYDVDDDNMLLNPSMLEVFAEHEPQFVAEVEIDAPAFNPYPIFGAPRAWPRGFPLKAIKSSFDFSSLKSINESVGLIFHQIPKRSIAIYQSLANHDPDVDAIYRLVGEKLPFDFGSCDLSIVPTKAVYPAVQTMTPYNAQATIHHHTAFWGLLLPKTVHGRVSDIWRSYYTQRLLWDIGARVAFTSPFVTQVRNAHDYLRDLDSEQDLYMKADVIVDFMRNWSSNSTTIVARMEELIIEMYERNFLGIEDVHFVQSWIEDLISMGYKFPELCNDQNSDCFLDDSDFSKFSRLAVLVVDPNLPEIEFKSLVDQIKKTRSFFENLTAQNYLFLVYFLDDSNTILTKSQEEIHQKLEAALANSLPNRLQMYRSLTSTKNFPKKYLVNNTSTELGNLSMTYFLLYELYRHPLLQPTHIKSIVRITPTLLHQIAEFDSTAAGTLINNLHAGRFLDVATQLNQQLKIENHLLEQTNAFVSDHINKFDMAFKPEDILINMSSGFELKDTFNSEYYQFLDEIDFIQGNLQYGWTVDQILSTWLTLKQKMRKSL